MPEINLISAEQKRLSRTRRTVWTLTVVAVFAVVVSLTVAAVIYSLHLVKKTEIFRAEASVAGLEQQLTQLSKIEQRQALIYDRLFLSQKIIASRPQIADRLNRLINTFPRQVNVDGIKIAENEKSSEVMIQSASFLGFYDSFRILQAGGFSSVALGGINRDKQGVYKVKLIITL